MFDAKQLLDQFLGGNPGGAGGQQPGGQQPGSLSQRAGQMATQARDRLNQASGAQAFGAGALSGGLLGMLVGGKKMRKLAGGAVGYGGAAVLGAVAWQAWQSYRASQAGMGQNATTTIDPAQARAATTPASSPHAQLATDGGAFALVLVRGMIAAARADGHIDADEQRRLFSEVERMGLDGEGKALVFDALSQPVDIPGLVAQVATPEQAAELYLASRLAVDPDHPAERAYLDALAARLGLPTEVRATLEQSLA